MPPRSEGETLGARSASGTTEAETGTSWTTAIAATMAVATETGIGRGGAAEAEAATGIGTAVTTVNGATTGRGTAVTGRGTGTAAATETGAEGATRETCFANRATSSGTARLAKAGRTLTTSRSVTSETDLPSALFLLPRLQVLQAEEVSNAGLYRPVYTAEASCLARRGSRTCPARRGSRVCGRCLRLSGSSSDFTPTAQTTALAVHLHPSAWSGQQQQSLFLLCLVR
mmetsp:Transcript_33784/g.95617  ORF Transcript_33784/g.95617 Transcript_33784/m.95617 type:complete len:229 (-) Transcript_33784:159-845(-)